MRILLDLSVKLAIMFSVNQLKEKIVKTTFLVEVEVEDTSQLEAEENIQAWVKIKNSSGLRINSSSLRFTLIERGTHELLLSYCRGS